MTTETGADGSPRQLLLDRVVDHLHASGSQDLSLRGIGAAVGTSHRMLIYHFGSLDGLLDAVVTEVEQRQRAALIDLAADPDMRLSQIAGAFWQRLRAPELRSLERLFFELYGRGLGSRPDAVGAAMVLPWLAMVEEALVGRGFAPEHARALARQGIAIIRGLLLDLLATGDEEGVDAAMGLYLRQLDAVRPN